MSISQLGLEEIIRNYEREDKRKTSLESKASYFLVIISLIAGLWGNTIVYMILNYDFSSLIAIFFITSILSIIFLFISAYFSIDVISIRNYGYPILSSNPDDLRVKLSEPLKILTEELFNSYLVSFTENKIRNNKKAKNLRKSYEFLIINIIFILVSFPVIGVILWS